MNTNKYKNLNKILFWNVDTQYDFMRNDEDYRGTLTVAGAKNIEGNLEKLTKIAEKDDIKVVNTGDWHTLEDAEIDAKTPDFKNTYPPHCMQNTKGAEYVPATNPKNPYVIDWNKTTQIDANKLAENRNITLYKNNFDAFAGNQNTEKVLNMINPEAVFVYGVATNVCVNFAVEGLLKRNKEVYVVLDAIKELPNEIAATPLEQVLDTWKNNGAKFITTNEVENLLNANTTKKYLAKDTHFGITQYN